VSTTLRDFLCAFTEVRVLVLGDLLLDEYVWGESTRISSEAPVPVVQFQSQHAVPGGAANTAANVAALGGSVTVIGLLNGDDAAGRELTRICAAQSIRLIGISDGRSTTRKVRVMGQQQQLLRIDYEEVGYIRRDTEERALREFAREVHHADIVVVSDYAKGFMTSRLCQQVIAMSHASGKQVVIDPRPQHASFYVHCDYLTPNWKESQGLLRRTEGPATDEEIEATGRLLTSQFHSNVLLTLGARGIAYFPREGGDRFRVAAAAKEVFDVSGAGDTVVATFALAHATGCPVSEAVGFANRVAGIVVAKRGTATATPQDLLAAEDVEVGLVGRDALRRLCASFRATAKRIATVTGPFDGSPRDYLPTLRRARREADVLVVGVREESMGAAETLLALRDVDVVHLFGEDDAAPLLDAVQPDVHVVGAESGVTAAEAAAVERGGGRLLLLDARESAFEERARSSPALDGVRSPR
jgi:D-beta-D-heptose 7-phosphate kinase / D-beta-D-heptose 1-phosphate adenosyltransferase